MPGQGFHLNDFEQSTLQSLIAALSNPGTGDVAGQLGLGIISGAQDRRQQNLDERQAGVSALQQQAMQLASQGASPDAVMAATMGQANDLPLMGGQRGQGMLGDLAGYVGGLYQGASGTEESGPISGLAPADYRAQFQPPVGGLDQEDQAVIGQTVSQMLSSGTPFIQIREAVRRQLLSLGMDEPTVSEGVSTAESMYEQMIGTSLPEMRSTADQLRQLQANDPGGLEDLFRSDDNQPAYGGIGAGLSGETVDVQSLMGQLANQPGALSTLAQQVAPTGDYAPGNYDPYADQPWYSYLPFGKNFLSGGLMGY